MKKFNGRVTVRAAIGTTELQTRLLSIMSDRHSREEVHQELGKFCEPFIPKGETEQLRKSMHATATGVTWSTPYANYQFEGEVYGPNIPGVDSGFNGLWRSGLVKHPTGRKLGAYTGYIVLHPEFKLQGGRYLPTQKTDVTVYRLGYSEPGTSSNWFDVALKTKGKAAFTNRITNILKRRAKRLKKTW